MEKIVWVDTQEREWRFGRAPIEGPLNVLKPDAYVVLPFWAEAMYPTTLDEPLVYAACCLCGNVIESGTILITFMDGGWGARLGCLSDTSCEAGCVTEALPSEGSSHCLGPLRVPSTMARHPIAQLNALLEPIIAEGARQPYDECHVCSRIHCTDADCARVVLPEDPLGALLEHLYDIRLDVCSPLVGSTCAYCSKEIARKPKMCQICRAVAYCNASCRRLHREHHVCRDYYSVWIRRIA